MCYTCIVSRACGHDSYQTVTCELAQPHGPLYNPLHCPDYQCLSSHTHEQCGKGGFYCAKTQDGAILDKAHDAAEVLHARLIENGSQLQIAFAANQNLLQSGTANQNLLTSPEYQRLWQNHNFLNQRRQNLERQHAYAIALISHGLQNRDRLAPSAFGQIPFSITHFDLASSIFTEDQLAPIRSLLPGRRIQPAVPQHNAGQVPAQIQPAYNNVPAFAQQQVPVPAQQSLINVPSSTQQQVPARAQQALANSVSTQQQVPGLTYSPSEPNVEAKTSRPTVNVAALSHEEIQERYRGFSPEGETKIEKGRRIGQMMKADSDKHVADQMAALGYNNIRPAPKAGNRRIAEPKPRAPKSIEKPKSEPKTTGTDSPKVSSTAAISTTPAVRRSARNLGVKHNYAETRGDSGVDADSRDPSPDKNDAAYEASDKNDAAYESPDKSESSPSPSKSKKGNRTRNIVAPTSATRADTKSHAKATLGETILQYKQGLENGPDGIKAATSSNAKGETPRADTPVLPSSQTPKQSKFSQLSVQNPSQAVTGRYRQILPAQSVQSPPKILGANPAAQRSSQLAQELGRTLYAHQVAAGMHGAQMVAPNTMPMSHPRPQNQHPNIMQEMAPASLTNYTQTQNVSSRPMPMQASRSTYGMAPMGTPNMFHQNLQQSMSGQATNISGLGYYPAHAGQMSMSGVPIQSSQSSSMPTNFDAPRPSGGATSLNFTDPLPSNHAAANTEPVKRTLSPSASSPNMPKRARLSLPGEGNAPTLAPTGPHSQNSIPANSPLTKSSDLKLSFGDTVPHQNLEVLASFTTTHPQPDPQNTTSTDQPFETLADSHSGESEPVDPLEFLLQNTQKSFQIPSAEEDAGASANAHTGEVDPLDPSDFFSLAAQEGYELPSADADTGAWADTHTAESNPIDPGDFLTMNAQGDYQFPSEDWTAGENNQFSADDNRLTSHWMDMINDPDE